MGTLGKALGAAGAFVAGERRLVDLLVTRARTFVFTTAPAPAASAAALAALAIVAAEPERRTRVLALTARMKAGLARLGFDVARVAAPIFPVVLGDEARGRRLARAARPRLLRARDPSADGAARHERAARRADRGHTDAQVDAFLGALEDVLRPSR